MGYDTIILAFTISVWINTIILLYKIDKKIIK